MKKLLLALIVGVSSAGMMGKSKLIDPKNLFIKHMQKKILETKMTNELTKQIKEIEYGLAIIAPQLIQNTNDQKKIKEIQSLERELLKDKHRTEKHLLNLKQRDQKSKKFILKLIKKTDIKSMYPDLLKKSVTP